MEITFLPTNTSEIHLQVDNCYRTPTEHWQMTSDLPKGKKLPTYLDMAKEKRKHRDKRIGMGPAPRGGSCEGGSFHTLGSPFTGGDRVGGWGGGGWGGGKLQSHGGECSNRGAEGKAERFPHRGTVPTSTHQPERLVCSPARTGRGWELRLRLQRSDPRERTGGGYGNTA